MGKEKKSKNRRNSGGLAAPQPPVFPLLTNMARRNIWGKQKSSVSVRNRKREGTDFETHMDINKIEYI